MIEAPTFLDFYKTFHAAAYKPGTSEVYANFTTRHGKHTNIPGGATCRVGGLQACIKKIFDYHWGLFFNAKTEDEAVGLYEMVVAHGLGKPANGENVRELYRLGYLPLEIKGLPEGMEVPYGIPHFTVKSTKDGFGWLTNNGETVISAEVWPVQTALTTADAYYKIFEEYAELTGSPKEFIPFQGHDFSFRGMPGVEAAKLTGMGHLMSGFVGSDTVPAAIALYQYYDADLSPENPCATIASVDATEHSVQCSFMDDEAYLDHCMDVASPTGILSIVSDGFDFWKLVTEFIPARKEKIMKRNGKVVIRPDSGDPVEILCGIEFETIEAESYEGFLEIAEEHLHDLLVEETPHGECGGYIKRFYKWNGSVYDVKYDPDWNRYDKQYYYIDNYGGNKTTAELIQLTPEQKGLVEYLYDVFGGTLTEKGFKVLDEHIGCIYGDSITLERQRQILQRLMDKGFASCNVVLGIGSFTYQYVTRDTHGSAVKATSIVNNEERIAIAKDPKGDSSKKSAKGLLYVHGQYDEATGEFDVWLEDDVDEETEASPYNMLQTVWKDGKWIKETTLEDIRNIVRSR